MKSDKKDSKAVLARFLEIGFISLVDLEGRVLEQEMMDSKYTKNVVVLKIKSYINYMKSLLHPERWGDDNIQNIPPDGKERILSALRKRISKWEEIFEKITKPV